MARGTVAPRLAFLVFAGGAASCQLVADLGGKSVADTDGPAGTAAPSTVRYIVARQEVLSGEIADRTGFDVLLDSNNPGSRRAAHLRALDETDGPRCRRRPDSIYVGTKVPDPTANRWFHLVAVRRPSRSELWIAASCRKSV